MLTLSQATYDSRKILKIVIIIVGAILAIMLLFRILVFLKEAIFPTPHPLPTVSFNTLPKIAFPQNATEKKLSYKIDTLSGGLPVFPDRLYVNKMVGYTPNILDVQNANVMAGSINLPTPGTKLSDTVYRWSEPLGIQRQLTMNVVTRDFIMTSLFLSDPVSISGENIGGEASAKQSASGFISAMNEIPSDLEDSKTSAALYLVSNSALMPATSLSNTQIIGIYFYQSDVNKLPIMYPKAEASTMNILVASGQYQPQVVAANFSHQSVSAISATYPIKTAKEAFDDLKNGKGYISTYYAGDTIAIKKVTLAYFMGEEKQQYLMPIVVFQGDNGFYAYISAIKDEWIKK